MNKKGFTLMELLATLVILGLIFGISVVGINYSIRNAKKKTEKVFINTLRDAIEIYLDDSANFAGYTSSDWYFEGQIKKSNNDSNLYSLLASTTFDTIINSEYTPIVEDDLRNPATGKLCDKNAKIDIFKDDDEVYYYYIKAWDMYDSETGTSCLLDDTTFNYITNLSDYAIAMIYG